MRAVSCAWLASVVGLLLAATPSSAAARAADAGPAGAQADVACLKAAWFARLPAGWHQQSAGCAGTLAGGSLSAWTQATSWRFTADPHGPLHQLRPGRVLIEVILIRPRGFPYTARHEPLVRAPLNLAQPDEVAMEEGAPTIPQYRFFRRFGCQYEIDLRVDFGTLHPTRTMLRAAQRALNGLLLHRW